MVPYFLSLHVQTGIDWSVYGLASEDHVPPPVSCSPMCACVMYPDPLSLQRDYDKLMYERFPPTTPRDSGLRMLSRSLLAPFSCPPRTDHPSLERWLSMYCRAFLLLDIDNVTVLHSPPKTPSLKFPPTHPFLFLGDIKILGHETF